MRAAYFLLLAFGLSACGEEKINVSTAEPVDRRAAAVEEAPAAESALPPAVDLQEIEFTESDRSRDPFRNFARAFVNEARGQVRSQRQVILDQYSIEELKLVGIISKIHPERAMLVDPTGVGHIIQRGQFVGRATVVQPTGGMGAAYEVHWRVDRIRDGDLILVRDDPSNPDVPSSTRVLQLRTDEVTTSDEGADTADVQNEINRIKERLQSMEAEEAARQRAAAESSSN